MPIPAPDIIARLEAALFIAREPIPAADLSHILDCPTAVVSTLCDVLNNRLINHGIHVVSLAAGFALATRPEVSETVEIVLGEFPNPEDSVVFQLDSRNA
jgi:chromosome segregation and condensation protein ScpB